MFLPLGDTPNPRRFTPFVNWALIAANAAIYLFISMPLSSRPVDLRDPRLPEYIREIETSLPRGVPIDYVVERISQYDLFVFSHGYKPGAPDILDLLFAMFLHANLLHLAGNMLFLWIYGDNVEHRLGRFGYLLVYLGTGAVATLAFALLAGDSMTPMVGASGAISGVLGLYFLLFPRNHVKLFVALFPFFFDIILLPARWVLTAYVVLDNLLPILIASESSVAYGAHLGGFAAGLAVAWAGEKTQWQWPWSDRLWRSRTHRETRPRAQGEPAGLGFLRSAVEKRDLPSTLDALARVDSRELQRLPPSDCARVASWLDDAGHTPAAARLLRNCLAAHPGSQGLAEVYLTLGLLRLKEGQATAAYQHLLSVFDHYPSAETARAAREALQQINLYRRKRDLGGTE